MRQVLLSVIASAVLVGCALTAPADKREDPGNGIDVEAKIYKTRELQTKLLGLSSQLGQLSGLDQASLTSRLGGVQGITSSQFGMNLQATTLGTPSTTTTATTGTPSVAQTLGNTTTTGTTPQIVSTQGAPNTPPTQIVTTTPSNTVQNVSAMPAGS